MRRLMVGAALVALVLAGCGSPAAEPSASPSVSMPADEPSVTASPTATSDPSPSPSATNESPSASPSPTFTIAAPEFACEGWDDASGTDQAIGYYRFAGICVGMTFDQAEATAPGLVINQPAQCPWLGEIVSEDPLYVLALTGPDAPGDYISLFILRYLDDPATVRRLEMPLTDRGITIGNTADDVMAAYPWAVEVTNDDPARGSRTQLIVEDVSGFAYAFDITDGLVSEISWGEGLVNGGPYGDICAL